MTGVVVLVLRILAALALYAFLGFALWLIWKQLQLVADRSAHRFVPHIKIETRVRNRAPVLREFSQPVVTLGRDPLSDLPLSDRAISAQHARLSFHHGQWWVDDLASKNGTRLNGHHLTGPTVLADADEIQCGSARLLITFLERLGGDRSSQGGFDD